MANLRFISSFKADLALLLLFDLNCLFRNCQIHLLQDIFLLIATLLKALSFVRSGNVVAVYCSKIENTCHIFIVSIDKHLI